MAHDAYKLLCLLQDVEIEQRHLKPCRARVALHAVDMALAERREACLALLGHGQRLAVTVVAVGRNHLFRKVHQFVNLTPYGLKLDRKSVV